MHHPRRSRICRAPALPHANQARALARPLYPLAVSKRNVIQEAFDAWGRACSFRKRSGSWYNHADDVISVTNLQRSQYGSVYYINQGFWLPSLGEVDFPKDHQCHIRARLGGLLDKGADRLEQLLNLDHSMTESDRAVELTEVLNNDLFPVIRRAQTISGLRAMLSEGRFRAAGIRGPAQELLAATA
jgi:hypothetical protein